MNLRRPDEALAARIHLLVAKEAPVVIVLRRKPSKRVHVLRWNTEMDQIDAGSWFQGRIYELRSDVSFDGRYMIYMAMGDGGDVWTGLCEPPFLRTLAYWPDNSTYYGGGLFTAANRLELNQGREELDRQAEVRVSNQKLSFELGALHYLRHGGDEGVLYPRLERDGFRREGPMPPDVRVLGPDFRTVCENDPGWIRQFSARHPILRVRNRGYASGRGRFSNGICRSIRGCWMSRFPGQTLTLWGSWFTAGPEFCISFATRILRVRRPDSSWIWRT